jgi:Tetratricopeptide repeat
VEVRNRDLGAEHPDTLTSLANLACTGGRQGRWKEAEHLLILAIGIWNRVLGETRERHPDILTSMAKLVFTYWNQGTWIEAASLGIHVLRY